MAVKIVTDSTADLPSDVVNELGITVVPANVRFGNDDYKDGVDLSSEEFFDKLVNGPDFPTTSQPSIGEFRDAYERVADGADGIVSVHVSGKLSGTMNSATQGSSQASVDCPIEVLDTRQASMGSGLVAMAAARAAQDGASVEEAADAARSAIARSQCFALLDTLDYLIKGGRIGKARGAIGKMLRIKPMIILRDGEVNDLAKERARSRAVARLRRTAEEFAPLAAVVVMHSTTPDEASALAADLAPLLTDGADAPMTARFGPALGTYVGPNSLGITLLSAEG